MLRLSMFTLASLVLALAAAVPSFADPTPSFDCARAGTAQEKAICDSMNLAWLDAQVATAYTALRKSLSEGDRGGLLEEQRAWLARRNGCRTDHQCLERRYWERLRALAEELGTESGTGRYDYISNGYAGDLWLATFPDGRVAARFETVSEGRGHMCTVDFVGRQNKNGKVVWKDTQESYDGNFCKVTLTGADGEVEATVENCQLYCGMAGSFEGTYQRAQ